MFFARMYRADTLGKCSSHLCSDCEGSKHCWRGLTLLALLRPPDTASGMLGNPPGPGAMAMSPGQIAPRQ